MRSLGALKRFAARKVVSQRLGQPLLLFRGGMRRRAGIFGRHEASARMIGIGWVSSYRARKAMPSGQGANER